MERGVAAVDGRGGGAEELVDAAGERERPAAVDEAACDGNFELGGGGGGGGLRAEFVVPVGAELGAPKARGAAAAAGVVGAEREGGELPDAQSGGASIKRKFHASGEGRPEGRRGKLKSGPVSGRSDPDGR